MKSDAGETVSRSAGAAEQGDRFASYGSALVCIFLSKPYPASAGSGVAAADTSPNDSTSTPLLISL